MAHITADRVYDTSTTTGTGALTVSGTAPTSYRTFSAVCATNDTFYYSIQHQTANEWETGFGTYSSANTITRTTVSASSNSNSAVNFSAGTKDVFLSFIASKTPILDNTSNAVLVTSGGTGQTSYTNGQLLIGNSTGNTLTKATLTQGSGISVTNGAGAITLASVPRVSSTTSITSPLAWNSDNYDLYAATAQSAAFTISADAGNPVDGEKAVFRILDNGTTRTITFTGGASKAFKPVGVALTASGSNWTYATTANKTVYFGCIYNAASARWEIIALSLEA